MGTKLIVGTQMAFGGSMAEAIENGLASVMASDTKPGLPSEANAVRDRRELFLAIAQGVISHLAANADAFQITYDSTTFTYTVKIATG